MRFVEKIKVNLMRVEKKASGWKTKSLELFCLKKDDERYNNVRDGLKFNLKNHTGTKKSINTKKETLKTTSKASVKTKVFT